MLILVGSGVIVYASAQRAGQRARSSSRSASASPSSRFASLVNLVVSAWLFRRAAETDSPALEGDAAHLRTDAYTSLGVLVGLALVHWTG